MVNRANSGVDLVALQHTQAGDPSGWSHRQPGKLVVEAANQGTSVFLLDAAEQDQFTKDLVALTEHAVGEATAPARATRGPSGAGAHAPVVSRFLLRAAARPP